MKYAIKKTHNGRVELRQATEVPKSRESDPIAWLTVQFPTIAPAAWVIVDDNRQHGDVDNGDGTYTARPKSITRIKPPRTWDGFRRCFTEAEMVALDNIDDDAYLTSVGIILTTAQRAEIRSIIEEWRVLGRVGALKASQTDIDKIKDRGFVLPDRVPDIVAGVRKR